MKRILTTTTTACTPDSTTSPPVSRRPRLLNDVTRGADISNNISHNVSSLHRFYKN